MSIGQNSFLTGEKIDLAALRRVDLDALARWWDDADVTLFLEMGGRPTREKDIEAFWRMASESEDNVAFAIRTKGGSVVGTCGLYGISWICRRAQFNILIGEKHAWGKGYGTEAAKLILHYAFDKLNLESVQLGVNVDNQRAIASYKRAGFVAEGVRRRFIYRNGQYYDMAVFSVLRDEYKPAGAL